MLYGWAEQKGCRCRTACGASSKIKGSSKSTVSIAMWSPHISSATALGCHSCACWQTSNGPTTSGKEQKNSGSSPHLSHTPCVQPHSLGFSPTGQGV